MGFSKPVPTAAREGKLLLSRKWAPWLEMRVVRRSLALPLEDTLRRVSRLVDRFPPLTMPG